MIRPPLTTYFDFRLLRKLREERGLNRGNVFRDADVHPSTLCGIEHGLQAPGMLALHRLARYYELDSLEVGELLRLGLVTPMEMRNFRTACRHANQTPAQAIRGFIRALPDKVKSER